jgi:lipoprotein NlpD
MQHLRALYVRVSAWRGCPDIRHAGEGDGGAGIAERRRYSAVAPTEPLGVGSPAWAGAWSAVVCTVLLGGVLAGCASQTPAPVTGMDDGVAAPEGYHRIRQGETLSELAVRLKLDLPTLAQWNRLTPPYKIVAGKLLRVAPPPAGGGGAIASTDTGNAVRGSPIRSTSETRQAPGFAGGQTGAQQGEGRPGSSARDAKAGTPKASPASVTAAETGSEVAVQGSSLRLTWQWPLRGAVEQAFAKGDRTRSGIRIRGRPGDRVVAAEAGSVVYSGSGLKGYGNLIIVKHNKNYLSAYGYNRKLLVQEGERVRRGQAVAEVGQAAGGHWLLHFEIRRNGTAVDPLSYLPRSK